jgi:RNA polymerase sigma-70 factor (ECF subfamily)
LLRYLTYLVGSEAEDIASETWLQATRDLGKFRGGHGDFRGWLTTIARNRAMDYLRRVNRQPPTVPVPVEELANAPGREDTADRAIEAITTQQALSLIAALPHDQAEAVLLRAVMGLDAKTAAQVVGKRAGAIRTAAYRGLKNIEKRIDRPALAAMPLIDDFRVETSRRSIIRNVWRFWCHSTGNAKHLFDLGISMRISGTGWRPRSGGEGHRRANGRRPVTVCHSERVVVLPVPPATARGCAAAGVEQQPVRWNDLDLASRR